MKVHLQTRKEVSDIETRLVFDDHIEIIVNDRGFDFVGLSFDEIRSLYQDVVEAEDNGS